MSNRESVWLNSDGLEVGFGTRTSYNAEGGIVHTKGRTKQLEIVLTTDSSGEVATGELSSKEAVIPAGAVIKSARVNVTTAITGATDFIVGLKDTVDGTTVDADGLVTAANSALTVGPVSGTGALIDTATSADATVSIDVTGTMTAGEASVLVEYEEAIPSQDAPAVITGIVGTL